MLNARTVLLAVGLGLGSVLQAAPAAAQTSIICQGDGNDFKDCPVATGGKVRLQQTLSGARCEYGRTWGFDWNSVWVDRGCRGIFLVNGSGSGWESGGWGQLVRCESDPGAFMICPVSTYGYVRLVKELSPAPCIAGNTWGYQADQIWVGNGCRGEFEVGYGDGSWQGDQRVVPCESKDGRYTRCFTRTDGQVSLFRQLSSAPCVLHRTWGYDINGVWVNDGCRGEFAVGRGGTGSGWTGYPGTWGISILQRAQTECYSEGRSRSYQNLRVISANQAGSMASVYMQGYRSAREYLVTCQYNSFSNRARITSEDAVGGSGNIYADAKKSCESKARQLGYQVIGSGPASQQSWGVKHDLDLRKGGLQYSNAYCNYIASSRSATLAPGNPDKQAR